MTSPVRFAGLVFDLSACTLVREFGEAIPLTRGEFRAFAPVRRLPPGRVLSRDAILEAVANRPLEICSTAGASPTRWSAVRLQGKIEPDPKTPRPSSPPCPARVIGSHGLALALSGALVDVCG